MTSQWAEREMEGLNTGDARVNRRTKAVLSALAQQPEVPLPQQFESASELKACYRLFDSDLVSSDVLLQPHYQQSVLRAQKHKTVVIASDSSSINFSSRKSNPDTGYISSNNAQGFLMHVSLATTLEKQALGVVGAKFWSREKQKPAKKVHRDFLPIEEKESYKWIESYRAAQQIAEECPETEIINVADREADILELWKEALSNQDREKYAHLIVRCKHNRSVVPTETNSGRKLFEFAAASPVVGSSIFELRDRRTHSVTRTVTQEIRASSVCIRPSYRPGVKQEEFILNVVFLNELHPPEGSEPISWMLLTTLPIRDEIDVAKIVKAYLARWEIEVLFRTFKSGCKVESKSLRTADRLFPMFTLFLIVAWRINNLVRLSRIAPDLPSTTFFSEEESRAAVMAITKKRPSSGSTPTINEILVMIARLGGYLNRKSDPAPGPTVIWRGLEKLRTFTEAWDILNALSDTAGD